MSEMPVTAIAISQYETQKIVADTLEKQIQIVEQSKAVAGVNGD